MADLLFSYNNREDAETVLFVCFSKRFVKSINCVRMKYLLLPSDSPPNLRSCPKALRSVTVLFVFETVCEFHKLRKNEVSPTSLGISS